MSVIGVSFALSAIGTCIPLATIHARIARKPRSRLLPGLQWEGIFVDIFPTATAVAVKIITRGNGNVRVEAWVYHDSEICPR